MNIILIILVFGIIVFFHELGHFLIAKANKISVTEFSIGMGPKLFSFTKKETKYSIRLLPIGGYCLMVGEDEESDDENAFGNKSILARALVVAAGPIFNFILAFIFSIILIHFTGCDPAELYYVEAGSAADEAGITEGDRIIKIDGDKIYNYRELLLYMQLAEPGAPVELTLETDDGDIYTTTVTPKLNQNGEYKLGVKGGYVRSENLGTDLKYGALECRYWFKATITSLKLIFTGGVSGDDVMGPVGVGGAMNDVIETVKEESDSTGEAIINIILNMLNWCILLSVNLGIMNLLPIPALDGGRLLFLIVEAVRRKKIPADKEAFVNFLGFVLLIIIMIAVFFNDVKNVFF
ncbi:MAG: M50 family metallopeptidase [Wujia sp.]